MLSQKELTSILINLICGKLLLSYPRRLIQQNATAAWLQMLYVTALVFFVFWLTTKVYTKNKSVIALSGELFGRCGKIIVGLICFVVLGISFVSVFRIYGESVKIVLLQNTDVDLILGVFVLVCSIGTFFGIRATAKITYIALGVAGVIFGAFLLLLMTDYNSQNIAPIFGWGAKKLFLEGVGGSFVFSDILALNLLLSRCENTDLAAKSGKISIVVSGLVGALICFSYCLIFPYPTSEEFIMPLYQLSRFINTSSFFNRFEAFFQFTWSILLMLYGSVYVYLLCEVWKESFDLQYKKPLIFSVSLLVGGVSLLPDSMMDFMGFFEAFEVYVYPVALLLPLIIGGVHKARKKEKI